MKYLKVYCSLLILAILTSCGKQKTITPVPPVTPVPESFSFNSLRVNGLFNGFNYTNVTAKPVIKISFTAAVNQTSVANSVSLKTKTGVAATYSTAYENNDSTIVITPTVLLPITQYSLDVSTALKSSKNGALGSAVNVQLTTAIDSTNKFPVISDDQLLDLVEKQTLKYFWDLVT
jgi:hypothetical protein